MSSPLMAKQWQSKKKSDGFSIPELVVTLVVSGIVVGAGLGVATYFQRSSQDDRLAISATSSTDRVLSQIIEEVGQSQKILTSTAELPSGCNTGGGNMVIGLLLPPQAYGKGDYQIVSNAKGGMVTRAEQNAALCPIIVGTRNAQRGEKGPYIVYRYGPQIDDKGFYISTTSAAAQSLPLSDSVSGVGGTATLNCKGGWIKKQSAGVEACVDQYRKSVQLSITKSIAGQMGRQARYIKRSAAGSAKGLDSSLMPVVTGSTGGTGIGGNTCYLGQCGRCDGTTFLIDNSGSMGYRRMEKAKSELMAAIAKCGDGARINVMYFNSRYGQYSSANVPLNSASRNKINRFIRNIRAGGGTNPWPAIDNLMRRPDVKRLVVLTDGYTRTSGSCIAGGYMSYADCYAKYNAQSRPSDPVQIDSVGLDTSCSNWLGPLANKNGGSCVSARS